MPSELIEPLFVMIVSAGYGGIYEPGEWLAFPVKDIEKGTRSRRGMASRQAEEAEGKP